MSDNDPNEIFKRERLEQERLDSIARMIKETNKLAAHPINLPESKAGVDESKLIGNVDALEWATEFVRIFSGHVVGENEKVDIGLMLGWFANSIMAGYDTANNRCESEFTTLRAKAERLERVLRMIKNSVAIASWNVKAEFREWSIDCGKLIDQALEGIKND